MPILTPYQKPLLGAQLNRAHPLAMGLVGCWLFNERYGNNTYDSCGTKKVGTLTSMDSTTDWVAGGLDFDGINDNVEIGNGEKTYNDLQGSMVVRFKFNSVSTIGNFIAYGGADVYKLIGLRIKDYTGTIYSSYYQIDTVTGNELRGSTPLSAGEWHTIVFTSNGTILSMYVNGVPQTITTVSGENNGNWFGDCTGTTTPVKTVIGARYVSGAISYPLNGIISHLYIYNRPLSAHESSHISFSPYAMFHDNEWDFDKYVAAGGGVTIPLNQIIHHYKQLGVM